MIDLNPLDVLNKRVPEFCPVHFSKIKIANYSNLENIENWIRFNLSGRFWVGNIPGIDSDKFKTTTFVAFEEEKELTYFVLACPHLRS